VLALRGIFLFVLFIILAVLGVEFRASCCLGRQVLYLLSLGT
jgi:hypothetical protein